MSAISYAVIFRLIDRRCVAARSLPTLETVAGSGRTALNNKHHLEIAKPLAHSGAMLELMIEAEAKRRAKNDGRR
jgi:hypothetical protein